MWYLVFLVAAVLILGTILIGVDAVRLERRRHSLENRKRRGAGQAAHALVGRLRRHGSGDDTAHQGSDRSEPVYAPDPAELEAVPPA